VSDPITGLTNQGTYFVIVDGPGIIRLANTLPDALAGNSVPFSYSGPSVQHALVYQEAAVRFDASSAAVVDSVNHVLHLPGNGGFQTGDAVVYHVDPTLSSKQDLVFDESFDPVAAVNIDAETISIPDHGLKTGDRVTYQIGYLGESASPIGGLTPGSDYHVIRVADNPGRLAASAADAARGKAINLRGGATGGRHNLRTTRPVTAGDTAIGGLEDGELYYVSVLDGHTIRLCETEAEALD